MEGRAEAAAAAAPPSTFSQVVFTGIPHSYPPASPITCCYTLNAAFIPNRRDWVGIFKVGWSTTKDYHTFVWVEPCVDVEGQQSLSRQAVFKEYYLPKDESEYYQFCYVDTSGQVRGASTPFCFRNPAEHSLDSSTDDDLLVITTQEQVEQSVREKTELQKELDQTRAEKETLKIILQEQQQAAASMKEQNEQRAREMTGLMKELDQTKELNKNLNSTVQQQQGEIDRLKTEMETQQQNLTEHRKRSQSLNSDGASRTMEEKYERAVLKINLQKVERDELKATVDAQSEEISKLNAKLREAERELIKTRDSIELLEVDLQSSEKEKERLAAELQRLAELTHSIDEVREENRELCRRLSQQETPQQQSAPDDDLKAQCQALDRQLQDALEKLAVEREESENAQRQAEFLERELQQVNKQLEKVFNSYEQEKQKSDKYELQHREAVVLMTDKDIDIEDKDNKIMLLRQEKEELARENQSLQGEILGLRRVYGSIQAASNDDSLYIHPNPAPPADDASAPRTQQETRQQDEHVYDTIASLEEEEEGSLVCRHCEERFPGITQHELEQHEQSHRVCPFCTMICDNMEQAVFEDHVYSHEV